MDDISPWSQCKCGMPERWAANPKFPVEFDKGMNEYHLVCDGNIAVMRFCFWCGGCLPESKRDHWFSTPSEEEKQEIQRLLSTAKTAHAVLETLGKPDETFEWDETMKGLFEDALRWKQTLRYSSRWKTLILDVMEMPDGAVGYAMSGRYIGAPPKHQYKPRWWEFWKFND